MSSLIKLKKNLPSTTIYYIVNMSQVSSNCGEETLVVRLHFDTGPKRLPTLVEKSHKMQCISSTAQSVTSLILLL